MRRPLAPLFFLTLVTALFTVSFAFGQTGSRPGERPPFSRVDLSHGQKYAPGEVLVRFRPGTVRRSMLSSHARLGAVIKREYQSVPGLQLAQLTSEVSLSRALRSYRRDPNVLYAEPNYIVHPFTVPNDPSFSQQWGLSNFGQDGGTSGADVNAQQAWNVTTGSQNVVVAVIDSGMDYTHPDLAANVWSSPTVFSQTVNGVAISCPAGTHGFNAVAGSCDAMDDLGHGTHISGIIGAVGNNGVGVSGVNWNVKMLACKFIDQNGNGSVDGAVTCLDYVKARKDQGVKVLATNNSWGGNFSSQALTDAIAAQQQDGILFVTAAGNDFSDNDVVGVYPADYFLPNVVSVAATTRFDLLANFSNVGRHSVHLGAPGQEILSTLPGAAYGVEAGTSMSTPFVTGVAALLAAQDPTRDWRAIKNLILAGGDSIPSLAQTITGRRLNAYGSLTCSNSTITERLLPSLDSVPATVGRQVTLAALNVNCGQPAGPMQVTVVPGGQTISLLDDGAAPDQAAGDGIYTGQWTPLGLGNYTLTFSNGEAVQGTVLSNYTVGETDFSYQNISGTNLNLGDDDVASVTSPFPVQLGGGEFSTLYVSSNGTVSFTNAFGEFMNWYLPLNYWQSQNSMNSPPPAIYQPVVTLIAPFWQDLYPVKGTDQNVFWDVTGAAPDRQLVIEWRNVRTYDCHTDVNANVTFQVVFSEGSSDFSFNYSNVVFGDACSDQDYGAAASIGMEITQNSGTQWSFDQWAVDNRMSLSWTLAPSNPAPNPVPTITSLSPSSVPPGSGDTWVTITGTGFLPNSWASAWPSIRMVTDYVSTSELRVLVPVDAILRLVGGGVITINVTNPPPGGGTATGTLSVVRQLAQITSLSPSSIPSGSYDFLLAINGSNFVPNLCALWNDQVVGPTTYISPNQMSLGVPAYVLGSPGTATIKVCTGVNNTYSNALTFTITPQSAVGATSGPPASPGSPGSLNTAKTTDMILPDRFPGWRFAAQRGSDYLARFARRRAGLAPLNTASVSGGRTLTQGTPLPSPPPGFSFRPTLPADFLPTAVVAGDFNGDGHTDWAVANGGSNDVWIYLGKGDGTAQLPTIVPLKGSSPVALAAADMNHDGRLDLIVAEADSSSVGILLGNDDGTFGPERVFYVPGFPESLAVADFEGDGNPDVVVGLLGGYGTGQLVFLRGDGTGKLGIPVFHYGPNGLGVPYTFALAVADLNGDGLPDVVALDYVGGPELWDQGNPAGARVYLNAGNGLFKDYQQFYFDSSADPVWGGIKSATAVALGDVNGNGCIDAVILDSEAVATLFPGRCDGTFDTGHTRFFGAGILAAAAELVDVNGDGKLDLVSSAFQVITTGLHNPHTLGNCISVLLGDGAGNFSPPTLYRGEYGMYSIAVADLNGDGFPEIVSANQENDSASVYLNDGHGGFGGPSGGYLGYPNGGTSPAVYHAPVSNFLFQDVNGDGIKDLVLLEFDPQYVRRQPTQLAVLLGDGTGKFGAPIRSPLFDPRSNPLLFDFGLGDFQGRGIPDLLILGEEALTGQPSALPFIAYAKNNGDGTFQAPVLTPTSSACPYYFVVGDFNNDGKLDLMSVSFGCGPAASPILEPFLGNGDGTFREGATVSFNTVGYPTINGMLAVDVNGDGKLDLLISGNALISNSDDNAMYELLGNGDGTFQAPKLLFSNPSATSYFATADLNQDGIPDLVEVAFDGLSGQATYRTYLGQPGGAFQLTGAYGPFTTYHSPFVSDFSLLYGAPDKPLWPLEPTVGDFNGDGRVDVLAFLTGASGAVVSIGGGGTMIVSGAWSNTLLQVLAGNGDGTLTPSNTVFSMGDVLAPQLAGDVNGDQRTDLVEMDSYSSSYNVITAQPGDTFSVALVSLPVLGTNGELQVTLPFATGAATTIQLSASDPNISIPASVTIPAGTVDQNVAFQIGGNFNPSHVFALTGQIGSETHTAYGTQATSTQNLGFVAVPATAAGYFSPVVVAPSQPGSYQFWVVSLGGYSTQLQASCQGLPATAACQFSPTPIYLGAGSLLTVSLTITSGLNAPLGTYSPTVVFADGTLTQQVSIPFSIGSFSLSITPASQVIPGTGSARYNLMLTGSNGYMGPVHISLSGLPAGASCELPADWYAYSYPLPLDIQTQNVALGTYTLTVTGTAGSLIRSASATLVVQASPPAQPGLTGSITPTAARLSVGQSANFNITLDSQNGATGAVSFQCLNVPSGTTCAFNPSAPVLPANGNVSDTLTVQVNSRPAAAPPVAPAPWSLLGSRFGTPWPVAVALLAATIMLLIGMDRGKLRAAASLAVVIGIGLLFLATASCGGGGGSPGPSPTPSPSPVTFSIVVQASGAGVSTAKTIGTVRITVE
jgi:subtilisin family serine protease